MTQLCMMTPSPRAVSHDTRRRCRSRPLHHGAGPPSPVVPVPRPIAGRRSPAEVSASRLVPLMASVTQGPRLPRHGRASARWQRCVPGPRRPECLGQEGGGRTSAADRRAARRARADLPQQPPQVNAKVVGKSSIGARQVHERFIAGTSRSSSRVCTVGGRAGVQVSPP